MKRYCFVIELKEEHVEKYKNIHRNPWKELLEVIESANVKNLMNICFERIIQRLSLLSLPPKGR